MVSLLRIRRVCRGISQPGLEKITKIPQWRISLIERGVVAKSEEIERIASALEVDPDDLFSNGQVKNHETAETAS